MQHLEDHGRRAQQLEVTPLAPQAGDAAHEVSNSGTVDVSHVLQVKQNPLLAFLGELTNDIPEY